MVSAEPTESIDDRMAWLLNDDFIVESQLWELFSLFSGFARSSTRFTSARDINDCDLPVKKLDKPLLQITQTNSQNQQKIVTGPVQNEDREIM